MKVPFLIGRILFGGFFLKSGIDNLRNNKKLARYAETKGVPLPELAVALSALPLIVGGTSILLGAKPKVGTLAILGFLASVSPVMHDFWRNEDPQEREMNMINFAKNLALAGGALALMGVKEPWEASVSLPEPTLLERAQKAARKIAA